MPPVKAYKRPPPGHIDFASPRNLIGMPPPIESMMSSQPSTPQKTSVATSNPVSVVPPAPPAPPAPSSSNSVPPEPSLPPPPPPSAPPPPPPAENGDIHRQATPAESAIIPAEFPEPSPSEGKGRDLPTPPHSRSGSTERPISPLFEAVDEIEALQPHRSRQSSKSLSRRRSTHSRRSKDEMPEVNPTTDRPEHSRRTSGYALSTRSAKTADSERTERSEKTEKSEKSEKTDRTDKTDRDPKSRYMCESRSAAVKALYPNSPMAQSGPSSSKNSVSSSRNSISSSKKKDRDSKELKRERSIPDNGTWDTSSNLTSEAPNSELSG